ncbi:MAG: hypothetical protein JSV08_04730 [Acidobacteriota bacterium]|nr:MAG: hypothetical protein JSV08_04730 [Acidobacteriota bacterium]
MISAAVCVLWTGAILLAQPKGTEPLVPAPVAAPYRVEGRVIVYEALGVRATLRQVMPSEEAAFFEECTGRRQLLFSPDGTSSFFLLFALTLQNHSQASLVFNPGFITIKTNRIGGIKPLDYADLYMLLRARPQALADAQPLLEKHFWLQPETLPPGSASSRLLVFEPLPTKKTKSAVVNCAWLHLGGESFHLAFPYDVPQPPKRKRRR